VESDQELRRLAELLRVRNAADLDIARLIGRPVERGHLGEWIAARLFDLDMATSATQAGWDGRFHSGPLAGRTANIKFYGRLEGGLDLRDADEATDEYLILVGPPAADGYPRRGATVAPGRGGHKVMPASWPSGALWAAAGG
jgi:hypothetical protein